MLDDASFHLVHQLSCVRFGQPHLTHTRLKYASVAICIDWLCLLSTCAVLPWLLRRQQRRRLQENTLLEHCLPQLPSASAACCWSAPAASCPGCCFPSSGRASRIAGRMSLLRQTSSRNAAHACQANNHSMQENFNFFCDVYNSFCWIALQRCTGPH